MEHWYRYVDYEDWHYDALDEYSRYVGVRVVLKEYRVLRRTERCVVLDDGSFDVRRMEKKGKRVLVKARKRWACPTPQEALESFIRRKRRQVALLKHQLEKAKSALAKGKELQEKEDTDDWTEVNSQHYLRVTAE